jgi:predicted glycoside hydrolase/deacetylase ChbG (UPF0249 family)
MGAGDGHPGRRVRALVLALVTAGGLPAARPLPAQTWAERLGYPAGKRVLILHADDIGMCHEANEAARKYLGEGLIQSAAAMAPCPWFNEFAIWAKERPELDVGLHLTLTSEWQHYRWGPVSLPAAVPGLVDSDGYLWRSTLEAATRSNPPEVEKEIRAQIERALARGLRPGHLDTHMGVLYSRADYARVFLKLAEEYGIPALAIELTPETREGLRERGHPLSDEIVELARGYRLPKIDDFHALPDGSSYEEKRDKFFALVRSLRPGITEIIFHPSIETECLRAITGSWQQRSWEARLFADPRVREFFAGEGLLFTNWKEMMRRHGERRGGAGKAQDAKETGEPPPK